MDDTPEQSNFSEHQLEQQKDMFRDIIFDDPPLKEGQTWYLISTRWYEQFEAFVGLESRGRRGPHPGPIDNTPMLEPNSEILRPYARENTDYVIRSAEFWKKLHAIYGGGPALPRQVIVSGWNYKSVEAHPFRLRFIRSTDMKSEVTGIFSKAAKIGVVKKEMCEKMGLNPDDVRMWDFHNDQKLKILEDPLNNLFEERILDNQKMLMEERLPNGKWAKLATKRDREFDQRNMESVDPGLCGLMNLGNTCFMASGLQCLSNTAPLCEFMVTGKCDAEINKDNPLGSKGELLTEFSELLQDMWSGRMSAAAPRDFKWKLERFAPQFSGWQQHDSHELLAFLLDGLHEDLNRIKKKPYFESNEFEDLPEKEAAERSWQQHIARNNSFITDWCHGQLRSEVTCTHCPRVSKTFDPFMYLSCPLPEAKFRALDVLVWTQDFSKRPVKYVIQAPKYGTIAELSDEIARVSGTDSRRLYVCDVYSNRFFKHFKRDEQISGITDRDTIYAIEASVPQKGKKEAEVEHEGTSFDVVVLWKEERGSSYYMNYGPNLTGMDPPLIVTLPGSPLTHKQLYDHLLGKLARFFKKPEEGETPTQPLDASQGEDQPAAPAGDLPFFRIALTDRYGQVNLSQEYKDDDEMVLKHADSLVLVVNTKGTAQNVFQKKESQEYTEDSSCTRGEGGGEEKLTLKQCIALHNEREQLAEEEPWYCNQCKEHRRAFKKFDLWTLPKILIIQLKRFSYRNKHWREKIESLVHFPLKGLDLREFVQGPINEDTPPIYDLYAISNHFGALGGGHYTAFCKNVNNQRWYKFDDSSVSEVREPESVVTSAAYVLFYQRRDTLPPEGFKISMPIKFAEEAGASAPKQAGDADDEEDEDVQVMISNPNAASGSSFITSSSDQQEQDTEDSDELAQNMDVSQ